jgi:hypothetical protein
LKHAFQAGSTVASFAALVGEQQSNMSEKLPEQFILDFYVASRTENGPRNLDSETASPVARSDKCCSGRIVGKPYLTGVGKVSQSVRPNIPHHQPCHLQVPAATMDAHF